MNILHDNYLLFIYFYSTKSFDKDIFRVHWFSFPLLCHPDLVNWCSSDLLGFSMATKQHPVDAVPVSEVSSPSANASVEGVLTRIFQMKKSRMSKSSFF